MAVDVFLKIAGIRGESTDDKHKDEIDLLSWSWGINNPARGPARAQDFVAVKLVDVASPSLFDACCSGDPVRDATVTVRKAGKGAEEYLKIVMEEVLISNISTGASTGDALPMEQVALNFSKIEISYRQQREDGSLGGWVTSSCTPRGRRGP